MNPTSLADRVASLLPNTTAVAVTDSPQDCTRSCEWNDLCYQNPAASTYIFREYICCTYSGCHSQGCYCVA
jgi:hypothetical protein